MREEGDASTSAGAPSLAPPAAYRLTLFQSSHISTAPHTGTLVLYLRNSSKAASRPYVMPPRSSSCTTAPLLSEPLETYCLIKGTDSDAV